MRVVHLRCSPCPVSVPRLPHATMCTTRTTAAAAGRARRCRRSGARRSTPASYTRRPQGASLPPRRVRLTSPGLYMQPILLPPPPPPPPPPPNRPDIHGRRRRVEWCAVRWLLHLDRRRLHVVAPQVHQPYELRAGVLQRPLLVAVHASQRRLRPLRQLQQLVGVAPVPHAARLPCLPRL